MPDPPDNAASFTESIVVFCESFADFAYRRTARDDLRPGLRTIGYRKRVVIAFAIIDETVAIVGIFYGGRDHNECSAAPPTSPNVRSLIDRRDGLKVVNPWRNARRRVK